jgi:hypothetical protein
VELSKLRTAEYPIPAQWSGVVEALVFDSTETIERFLSDASTFPYAEHTIALTRLDGV